MKVKSESEVVQSCLTLSDPMDCSLPGSSVHGIFQARVLEWGAIAFSNLVQRQGESEKHLDVAFNLLVSPIGQSQTELTWEGSPARKQTQRWVSAAQNMSEKGRKLINTWKVGRKHTSTHIIPTLPIKQWVSEKHRIQLKVGEGNDTSLQYSCLENPMDGGAWWATVHGVAKSWTRLSDFTFTLRFHALEKEMATHSGVLALRILGTGKPCWAAVYGVAQSRTRLKQLSSSSSSRIYRM